MTIRMSMIRMMIRMTMAMVAMSTWVVEPVMRCRWFMRSITLLRQDRAFLIFSLIRPRVDTYVFVSCFHVFQSPARKRNRSKTSGVHGRGRPKYAGIVEGRLQMALNTSFLLMGPRGDL